MTDPKKSWETPRLRSEEVQETLAQPACNFKNPGHGGPPRGGHSSKPTGPAFS